MRSHTVVNDASACNGVHPPAIGKILGRTLRIRSDGVTAVGRGGGAGGLILGGFPKLPICSCKMLRSQAQTPDPNLRGDSSRLQLLEHTATS